MTAIQWTLLLATLTICDCQVQSTICIKPDKCPQEECCPSDCMTLSEYAIMNSNGTMYSRLELSPGEYHLNSTFSINGISTQSFSIIGSGSESTFINCTQKDAGFEFDGLSFLVIKYVSFVSCGVDTLPGVSLMNINTVNLVNTTFSKSTSGALDIQNCSSVQLTHLKISNNINSQSTIISVKNSVNVSIKSLCIGNNSIETTDSSCNGTDVVFRIDSGSIDADNILISDNIGPFGVMVVANAMVTVNGDWRFERNKVCMGGSLAFVKTTVNFNRNLSFIENTMERAKINQDSKSTTGLFLRNEALVRLTNGFVKFVRNKASIACVYSINSRFVINNGSLDITNHLNSNRAISFEENSLLNISNGSLTVQHNQFDKRVIVCNNSSILISGKVVFINNSVTPIALFSCSALMLSGQISFRNNAGILYSRMSKIHISGNNSTFARNHDISDDKYKDGGLTLVNSNLTMEGTYIFEDNNFRNVNGGGILARISSSVTFGGTGYFTNNSAINGGGLYISQLSRLELQNGTRLFFTGNTAVKGAAIFIETSINHTQCKNNPSCLFRHEDNINPNVSLTFQDNMASPGASVLHVKFDKVNTVNETYPALDALHLTINNSSLDDNSLPHFASDTLLFCSCNDPCEKFSRNISFTPVTAYKGKPFSVMVRARAFYGSQMFETVRATLLPSMYISPDDQHITKNKERLRISDTECSELNLTVKSPADSNVTIMMNLGESFIDLDKSLQIDVNLNKSCPSGFQFNDKNDACECDKSIKDFLQSCEITDTQFKKEPFAVNYWIAPTNDSQPQGAMSWYESCPHHYCITDKKFTFSDDGICAKNRYGLLCGQCKRNYSLILGGDLCRNCSDNSYLALILVFAAAGVLLIAFIFLTQITVTTGTINGLIFYANILNSNENVFLPEGFFPGHHIFISWLNLNFGIETCFFNGMTQISYTGLQFVFPLYMWFLAGVVIVLCRCSARISRFFGNSDPVAVLATIIFLSFNSLTNNIVNIFDYAKIKHSNISDASEMNHSHAVWQYDGSCFGSGNHLALLLVATVFIFLLIVPYILVLFSAPLIQKNKFISKVLRRLRLQPFLHAYLIPFKPKHRYWVGLSLFVRAMLLVLFAIVEKENRQKNSFFIFIACIILISIIAVTGGIYDKRWIDKLEISFLVNLSVTAAAMSFIMSSSNSLDSDILTTINNNCLIVMHISVTIALLTFIGIVILHIFWRLKKFKMVKKKIELMKKEMKIAMKKQSVKEDSTSASDNANSCVTSSIVSFQNMEDLREPLLESQKLH